MIIFIVSAIVSYPVARILLNKKRQDKLISSVQEPNPSQPLFPPTTTSTSTPQYTLPTTTTEQVPVDPGTASLLAQSTKATQRTSVNVKDVQDSEGVVQEHDHHKTQRAEEYFVPLMIVTACSVAFAHGGNDVSNGIGPFFVVLTYYINGDIEEEGELPLYVPVIGGVAVVIGLSTWGYKVMNTIGAKITPLSFSQGFAAQFGTGISVLTATVGGLPISTTAVIVGSILGVGLVENRDKTNFGVVFKIVLGWIATLPIAATFAILVFVILRSSF
jgi:phosphate/sulfate permease